MHINAPKTISECRGFFLVPATSRQRQYEAMRAYFVNGKTAADAARNFGYTQGTLEVMIHKFRREPSPEFFVTPRPGPRSQPKKDAARMAICELRKQNHSIYEISDALKDQGYPLSPTAVREVLKEEGFASLPRRLDEDIPHRPRPIKMPCADARLLSLAPRTFDTVFGGLFLFVAGLISLDLHALAVAGKLPGSQMIPAEHALRAMLCLKLWSIERRSHVMPHAADEGLALMAGLNCIPKRSFLSEYSSPVGHSQIVNLLAAYHEQSDVGALFKGGSFNLDFHSIPYFGEHSSVEKSWVAMRSRRQKSVLAFLAQDSSGRAFCYSNAVIRKGEEAGEILQFIDFWKRARGTYPGHLVFDCKLTVQKNLAAIDDMGIHFITLRPRNPRLNAENAQLPSSAWRKIELDVPTRKYRFPKVFEQTVPIANREFRQLFIKDLGHDDPTVLLSNDGTATIKALITRYAQRMLIENALSDSVRFFHMNALSSAVGMKVDFDVALMVIASGLYRSLAAKLRGYRDAQARTIFKDIVDIPATVTLTNDDVTVKLHRRAHLPIIVESGLLDTPTKVPWWGNRTLLLKAW
jgi:transposase